MRWRGPAACSLTEAGSTRCGAVPTRSCWRTSASWRATGEPCCVEPAPRAATVLTAGSVVTVTAAEAALRDAGETEPRPVVLGLLWSGRLRADLAQPLVADTELEVLW